MFHHLTNFFLNRTFKGLSIGLSNCNSCQLGGDPNNQLLANVGNDEWRTDTYRNKVRQEIDAQLREVGQNTSNNEKVTVLIFKNNNLIKLFLISFFDFFKLDISY